MGIWSKSIFILIAVAVIKLSEFFFFQRLVNQLFGIPFTYAEEIVDITILLFILVPLMAVFLKQKHTLIQSARALKESEEKYRSLTEEAAAGVYIFQNNKIVYANSQMETISGYRKEKLYTTNFLEFIIPEDRPLISNSARKLLGGEASSLTSHYKIFHQKGYLVDIEVHSSATTFNGEPAIFGTVINITERKKAEAIMEKRAAYDALTSLANRQFFIEHLTEKIHKSKKLNQSFTVMFIDLDGFKLINDTFGHDLGDVLLQEVGERIKSTVRSQDVAARYGGDEFVILFPDITSKEHAAQAAKRLIEVLNEAYLVKGKTLSVGASVGISFFPSHGETAEELLKHADLAMYQSKKQGKNTYNFY
ncbi:sensor domain-containing diguanylate cyclase [Bacillus taeanensis]|uniref:Diguanylate cyclase n=1 Tax=Bacillus taeanensis TaxID=273032 RepID=A0A366XUU9_9BACI|nr:sensor domain-containing diguanylate cyclase [Bacillus taeanensis]RBW68915.1 hypothetical protein DS031_14365 [Bacillus taeanensis]